MTIPWKHPVLCRAIATLWALAPLAGVSAENPVPVPPFRPLPPVGHIRVQWMHDPAEKAVVAWTTPVAGTTHAVYYDTQPRRGQLSTYSHKQDALASRPYTLLPADAGTPEGWAQAALLEQLSPATTYYFVVVSDGHVSRELHFVTAPADDRPVKLLYGADSRHARPNLVGQPHLKRREMNRMLAALLEEHPDILALAHGGDYCSYAEWRFLSAWLDDYDLTITRTGRVLPIIPARGNHDGKAGFEEVFHWPGRETPYYYSTVLAAHAVLITLNTNVSKAGAQRDWLESELARQRSGDKTIVAQYHVPAYPSVKSIDNGTQQRLHWVPLFERFDVSLVCEADDHMLKRTVPIFEDRHDPERGITYIGDGGLGVPQRVPDLTRWYLKSPGFAAPALHVHLLDFSGDELRVTAIGLQREVLDSFSVKTKVPALAETR